jgi:hypothetical protein
MALNCPHCALQFILEARQLKLLGELGSTIYPIEPVPVTASVNQSDRPTSSGQ